MNRTSPLIHRGRYTNNYIRFGDIPQSGKSTNHLIGIRQSGVSVYKCRIYDNNSVYIQMPSIFGTSLSSLSAILERPIFIISGNYIGTGSDGQPILQNCKIINEVKRNEIKM